MDGPDDLIVRDGGIDGRGIVTLAYVFPSVSGWVKSEYAVRIKLGLGIVIDHDRTGEVKRPGDDLNACIRRHQWGHTVS